MSESRQAGPPRAAHLGRGHDPCVTRSGVERVDPGRPNHPTGLWTCGRRHECRCLGPLGVSGVRRAVSCHRVSTEPHRRLAIGGPSPVHEGVTVFQEILLEARGGETTMRLVQSGFLDGAEWDDEVTDVESGWKMAFALMKRWLEQYPGARRSRRLILRPVAATAAQIRAQFEESALVQWWGGPGRTGEILVDTGTEVTRAWGQHSAAMGSRTSRRVLAAWWPLTSMRGGLEPPAFEALVPTLEAAVDRLATSLSA